MQTVVDCNRGPARPSTGDNSRAEVPAPDEGEDSGRAFAAISRDVTQPGVARLDDLACGPDQDIAASQIVAMPWSATAYDTDFDTTPSRTLWARVRWFLDKEKNVIRT